MSNVEFQEGGNESSRAGLPSTKKPFLVALIMKTGIVKDDKQANYVLIGIGILAVILTGIVIFG